MHNSAFRSCFREPIPEIMDAARYLDAAVSAYLQSHMQTAEELIRRADMPVIRQWTESIWGKGSAYVQHRAVPKPPLSLAGNARVKARMPTTAEKQALHQRDGYHCRFCGIPL